MGQQDKTADDRAIFFDRFGFCGKSVKTQNLIFCKVKSQLLLLTFLTVANKPLVAEGRLCWRCTVAEYYSCLKMPTAVGNYGVTQPNSQPGDSFLYPASP
jgi:hypothetical protein